MKNTKILLMSLLHLLLLLSHISDSSKEKNFSQQELTTIGEDIKNLFTPLDDINDVLDFFGKEMDTKVKKELNIRKSLKPDDVHYSFGSHNEGGLSYSVDSYDLFRTFGVDSPPGLKHMIPTLAYDVFEEMVKKKFDGKKISFLGLNTLLKEETTKQRLYMAQHGILKSEDDEYFLLVRTNPLVPEIEMIDNLSIPVLQRFNFARIGDREVYLYVETGEFMHIHTGRNRNHFVRFGYGDYVKKIALQQRSPKLYNRNGNLFAIIEPKTFETLECKEIKDMIPITAENMFMKLENLLLDLYIPSQQENISLMSESSTEKDFSRQQLKKIGEDIESTFTPLNDISDVLNFFGKEMDAQVKQNLVTKNARYYFGSQNECDFVQDFRVIRPRRYSNDPLDYDTFRDSVLKKFYGKKISFMGFKKILFSEETEQKRLHMGRFGILKSDVNKYYLIQRTNPLARESERNAILFQHFFCARIKSQDIYLHVDNKGHMHIQTGRYKKHMNQFCRFRCQNYENFKNSLKSALPRGLPKIFIQNGNMIEMWKIKNNKPFVKMDVWEAKDLISITAENMFTGKKMDEVLLNLYAPYDLSLNPTASEFNVPSLNPNASEFDVPSLNPNASEFNVPQNFLSSDPIDSIEKVWESTRLMLEEIDNTMIEDDENKQKN